MKGIKLHTILAVILTIVCGVALIATPADAASPTTMKIEQQVKPPGITNKNKFVIPPAKLPTGVKRDMSDKVRKPLSPRVLQQLVKKCPDLTVIPFELLSVRRVGANKVGFFLLAKVQNVGNHPYQSGEDQQVFLLETRGRGGKIVTVAKRKFKDVPVGNSSVRLSFSVNNWSLSNEFPEGFTAAISVAPDISIDGNLNNDECRLNNNKRTISGQEINRMVRSKLGMR